MYFTKTPKIVQPFGKDLLWTVNTTEKRVFLTFDDGPHPQITREVLALLKDYDALATFFCVGENARKYPKVLEEMVLAGHSIGNHTDQHLNGWKTNTFQYARSYLNCAKVVDSRLFRPPYGRITKSQIQCLRKRSTIVMWDVLSGDFDPKVSVSQCHQNVVQQVEPGSIVVFHDSEKAAKIMLEALPMVLKDLKEEGYEFHAINQDHEK